MKEVSIRRYAWLLQDTALHIALRRDWLDKAMVRLLTSKEALAIRNKRGVSAGALHRQAA
jgi:hypothetical protein